MVPCQETVGVYGVLDLNEEELKRLVESSPLSGLKGNTHSIPVCYELGDDLEFVADQLELAPIQVVDLHCSEPLECFAIGFCPGFGYLGPLPAALRGIPRMSTPRTRTEPGSVGLTGNQTAVYPLPRPGGWPIIGMTPLQLVDEKESYFPIAVGDFIQFDPISVAEFDRLRGTRL